MAASLRIAASSVRHHSGRALDLMTTPSPELEQQVRLSFCRLEPQRVFRSCKVAEDQRGMVVRIYSHGPGFLRVIPTPYQVFRFDSASGILSPLSGEDAAPYI